MLFSLWLATVLLPVLLVSAAAPSRRWQAKSRAASPFIGTSGSQFTVNGSPFKFIGTNAYWLPTLNSDADINKTLVDIAATGIRVVRVWGFNDVTKIPDQGVWFQLINPDGTTTVNTGDNGIARLDKVIELAKPLGIYVLITLTNNWNPVRDSNSTIGRNVLSNDYGGMDTYVRQFSGGDLMHDQFYTNTTFIESFKNYTTQIVKRYTDSDTVFAWEIANDPRCNSSLPSQPSCKTTTVTKWVSTIATHIKTVDPNHLVAAGDHGFLCPSCPKLFPTSVPPPASQPSGHPGSGRRKKRGGVPVRSPAQTFRKRAVQRENKGVMVRGRWRSPGTIPRQDSTPSSATDGSHGVDSQDITNIPDIGFSTFQLFPDQNQYLPSSSALPAFNQTVEQGTAWIDQQVQTAMSLGKPAMMTGFGLVTNGNAMQFVPFNASTAPFSGSSTQFGLTDQQRDDAYSQWLAQAVQDGLQGAVQYQWGQSNLTAAPGTSVSPNADQSGTSPNGDQTGVSPNDGYSLTGPDQGGAIQVISNAVPNFSPD